MLLLRQFLGQGRAVVAAARALAPVATATTSPQWRLCSTQAQELRSLGSSPLRQSVEQDLVGRVLQLIEDGTTDMIEHTTKLDVSCYTDKGLADQEHEAIFTKEPLIAARCSELDKPLSFVTRTVAGTRVLLVRPKDGGPAVAYLNVCRHRGTQLVNKPCGVRRSGTFVCPYHSWQYDANDGHLRRLPGAFGFTDMDYSKRGLVRLPCAERFGFVWIRTQPPSVEGSAVAESLDIDIEQHLGEQLCQDFSDLRLEELEQYRPQVTMRQCNWKQAFDVFLETYHVRFAHATTIWPFFLDNVGVFDQFGRHMRNLFPKRTIKSLADQPRATWSLRPHCNILYYIYPNTLLLVQPDHVSVSTVEPGAVGAAGTGACRIAVHTLLARRPSSAKEVRYFDKNIRIFRTATQEDLVIAEGVQASFSSGANSRDGAILGRFEHSLAYFHDAVAAACGRSGPTKP